jgi:hypothetical protein
MATATEFTVTLENRPGTLAGLSEALGSAGINIDGLQGMPCEGRGAIQLVANDPDGAAQALDGAGIQHTTREVLLLNLVNEPGALARVTRAMADAGINIDAVYVTMGQGVVLGVDNLSSAQQVASELGVA